MRTPRPFTTTLLLAAGCLVLICPLSAAEDAPSSEAGPQQRHLSLYVGGYSGTDTNPTRARGGDAESDSVTEILAGLAYKLGKESFGLELKYQMKTDSYAEQSDLDFEESRASLSITAGGSKARFAIDVEQQVVAEPDIVEADDNLQQTRLAYRPSFNMSFGAIEIGLGVNGKSSRCDDYDAAVYLDMDTSSTWAEFRWRSTETANQQIFAHFDLTTIDYSEDSFRSDFDRSRFYVGWRSEEPGRSGIEVGAGTDSTSIVEASQAFTTARYRTSLSEGGGALEVAYIRATEPAATADLKATSQIMVRYIHATESRIGWSISAMSERAEFWRPDDAPYPVTDYHFTASRELQRQTIDAALQGDFGSREGLHGRWHVSLRYWLRSGSVDASDYNQARVLAGASLVY